MIHTLQSNHLRVEISEKGAELHSLFSTKTKTEYLWQGDPSIWGKRAPVLFPIVGRLKDGKYTYNGVTYQMPAHGFASTADFVVEEATHSSLTFSISETAATLSMYPFLFDFKVIFSLNDNALDVTYMVTNKKAAWCCLSGFLRQHQTPVKTGGPMYFSFGSHEGYRCPRYDGEVFEDYYLEFDRDTTFASYTVSPGGLITGPAYPVIESGRCLPLEYGLFNNDSLVFIDIPSKKVALCSRKAPSRLEIEYGGAPNLVVWTKNGAPFICIEPWHGMGDFENSDGQLVNKLGIISLEEGGVYSSTNTIRFYE